MKKLPGTGSVDVVHISLSSSIRLIFEVDVLSHKPDHFDMVFIETQHHEAVFACPMPSKYRSGIFMLEWKAVEGVDPAHIERIELRMHKGDDHTIVGAVGLIIKMGQNDDATPCPLVSDKDGHGSTPASSR
jgi:hypothetical protein